MNDTMFSRKFLENIKRHNPKLENQATELLERSQVALSNYISIMQNLMEVGGIVDVSAAAVLGTSKLDDVAGAIMGAEMMSLDDPNSNEIRCQLYSLMAAAASLEMEARGELNLSSDYAKTTLEQYAAPEEFDLLRKMRKTLVKKNQKGSTTMLTVMKVLLVVGILIGVLVFTAVQAISAPSEDDYLARIEALTFDIRNQAGECYTSNGVEETMASLIRSYGEIGVVAAPSSGSPDPSIPHLEFLIIGGRNGSGQCVAAMLASMTLPVTVELSSGNVETIAVPYQRLFVMSNGDTLDASVFVNIGEVFVDLAAMVVLRTIERGMEITPARRQSGEGA